MIDLCLCSGGSCPLKNACLRYLIKPKALDNFFTEIPYCDNGCDFYMEVKDDTIRKNATSSKKSTDGQLG